MRCVQVVQLSVRHSTTVQVVLGKTNTHLDPYDWDWKMADDLMSPIVTLKQCP